MDKKILYTIGAIIIILIVAGVAYFMYWNNQGSNVPLNNAVSNTESSNTATQTQPTTVDAGVTIKSVNSGTSGSITVCSDKCGDNICQKTDTSCTPGSLNCICAESHQDCPADCKQ